MPRTITSVSIFLASPSDVDHERDVVAAAIDEWNSRHGREKALLFELLRWETSVSAGFRADGQDVINSQIGDGYDVLIALFWAKLGTPTPRAASGTVEEYRRAFDRFKRGEKIDMAFFFKDALIDFRTADLEQVVALKSFEKEVQEAGALTKPFRDDDGLKLEVALLLDRIARSQPSENVDSTYHSKTVQGHDENRTVDTAISLDGDLVDEDVGLFDAVESLQCHASAATSFLAGFTTYLDQLGSVTNEVTVEYNSIKKLRPLDPAEAKPGIAKISQSMDIFSAYLEQGAPAYSEDVSAVANDIRDMIRTSYDFLNSEGDSVGELSSFQSVMFSISSQMDFTLKQLDELINTTASMQRTTSQFNKARRRLLQNLNGFKAATQSGRALIVQALDELDVLIEVAKDRVNAKNSSQLLE